MIIAYQVHKSSTEVEMHDGEVWETVEDDDDDRLGMEAFSDPSIDFGALDVKSPFSATKRRTEIQNQNLPKTM